MARIRTVKPEFWTSDQIVECSPIARLLFIGMWNFADDRGVIPRRPRTIKMQVFPGDEFTADQIEEWITELESQRLLGRFEHEGSTFSVVTGWHHQKIERPTYKYPAPPSDIEFAEASPTHHRHVADTSPPEGNGMEGKGEEGNGMDTEPRKRGGFVKPTLEEVTQYCRERQNHVNPQAFLDHYEAVGWRYGQGNGKPVKDWQACVRTWEPRALAEYESSRPKTQRIMTPEEAEGWSFE
jgi:hypothetical protein